MVHIPGFQDLLCIYESNKSRIFRARREQDNLPVVLKALREDNDSSHEIARYQQEVKILSSLGARPGIIQTLGQGESRGAPFIVLEDFGADSLKSWVDRRAFSLVEKLALAARMASGIAEIHAAHVIHKDINLTNVVYNPETDTLKLIDFGLSTLLTRECPEIQGLDGLEGTLACISPEQTGRMNRTIDFRTDFYSLGASLYQLFTGRLPFEQDDLLELVHCHLARQPALPHEICPEIPPVVSAIVARLMAKTPEDRYQSAQGIQQDFLRCLKLLREQGRASSFALGQRDVPEQLTIPQKLYGREQELEVLSAAFARVAAGTRELTLVAGPSGVGKTALVRELNKTLTEQRGYFISGKFDALKQDQPYSALAEAFRQLMRQLLTEPEDRIRRWRKRLLAALGPNAKVIAKVIPDLELVLGPQPDVEEVGLTESQNRFNYSFQRFVQVFADPAHPLVAFIDDLQWADSASLKLLERIMSSPDTRSLHLIGAYRDQETSPEHPWMRVVSQLRGVGCPVGSISLSPLAVGHVNQLLADTLRQEGQETQQLAELLHSKTQGNPFFATAFLRVLYREGLLRVNRQRGAWEWELAQIKALGITDNVADLMAASIQRLSPETRRALSLAACIGNRFDLGTLAVVGERPPEQALEQLEPALQEGLVLLLGNDYPEVLHEARPSAEQGTASFKFVHDRVQQAAYALIPDRERRSFHWQIGKLLQKHGADLFDIANHLNHSIADLLTVTQRENLARLNLQAGQRAKAAVAYQQAFDYLQNAWRLLGEDRWEMRGDLAREIGNEAAEAAYLISDLGCLGRLARELRQHSRSILEQIKVGQLEILSLIARNQPREAIDQGLQILASLGFKLDRRPSTPRVTLELLKLKLILAVRGVPSLVDLPPMTDPNRKASDLILRSIAAAILFTDPKLYACLICKRIRVMLGHGHNLEQGNMLGSLALLLCGVGDLATGFQVGEVSVALGVKTANRTRCATQLMFNGLVRHWKEHLSRTTQPLLSAYQAGVESGDFEYAGYCLSLHCQHLFFLGKELSLLEPDLDSHRSAVQKLGQHNQVYWIVSFQQAVQNLLGQTAERFHLLGTLLDEREVMPLLVETNNSAGILALDLAKLFLCVFFHEHQAGVEAYTHARKYFDSARSFFGFARFHFLGLLACLGALRQAAPSAQKPLRKRIAQDRRQLGKWARHAPMNHLHALCLVEAERCRILGKPRKAIRFYRRASEAAREHGWVAEEGLAHELAGRFHLERREVELAIPHLVTARRCYLKWGARAKVSHMNELYGPLLERQRDPALTRPEVTVTSTLTTSKTAVAALDLGSVIKASQSISQEVEQGQLLDRLMKIAMENAGADKVVLVLGSAGDLQVKALLDLQESGETRLISTPLEPFEGVSAAIVHYVARTLQPVVLGKATEEGEYVRDPYVARRRPKSILVIPILRHGALTGVLYLENRSAVDAFTPDRVEVLRLLAAQSAISLDNARLYEQLKEALALAQGSDRLKTEFLARASHELRTPLNPIINAPEELIEQLAPKLLARCARCESTYHYEEGDLLDDSTPCPGCQGKGCLARQRPDISATELEEQLKLLKMVRRGGKQLFGVVSDILDFSKLELGKLKLALTRVEVSDVVSEVCELMEPEARKQHVKLGRSALAAGTQMEVDPLRLKQILINLLGNAIKFSKEEGGEVDLGVELSEKEVVFSIKDQGIGIAPENQKIIFESFRQLEDVASRRYGGSGLGLSIAKMLVESHHGEIWLESEVGTGSTFFIRLPRWTQSL